MREKKSEVSSGFRTLELKTAVGPHSTKIVFPRVITLSFFSPPARWVTEICHPSAAAPGNIFQETLRIKNAALPSVALIQTFPINTGVGSVRTCLRGTWPSNLASTFSPRPPLM